MDTRTLWPAVALVACLARPGAAQDPIFSGPQPGEKLPTFKALRVAGGVAPQEVSLPASPTGPVAIVFWHGIERSMLPLLRVVDQYGVERKGRLTVHHVVLYADRVEGERRLPLVQQSLQFDAPPFLSPDGLEGPGSYGLNKKCLLTILVGKDAKVTANFALVQPGIADAPKLLKALADAVGDAEPPSLEVLEAHARERRVPRRPEAPAAPATLDELRATVRALQEEVAALRREVAALKGGQPAPPPGPLPGAAPTDAKLLSLLRAFIQRSNSDARVDEVVKEVEAYVAPSPDLKKQAIDGWVRVLHLKYGTEYAQKAGQALVERLKK